MTLNEIERQLNEGDNVVLTSGEHYVVCVNPIKTDFQIYYDGALMYFLTMHYAQYGSLDNVCVHRLHFDRFVVETFKLDLSRSEITEIKSMFR